MGRPGDEARMAKMRARRAPFTDARDGRLVQRCYWVVNFQGEEIKSWHRANVSRVADLLAIRIGRATSQGAARSGDQLGSSLPSLSRLQRPGRSRMAFAFGYEPEGPLIIGREQRGP